MTPVRSAVVSYAHSRSCFLFVPESWIKPDIAFQEIPVFKIEYGKSEKAYFSCQVSSSHRATEDEILLNGKYALTLGIKDKEQVLIEQVEQRSVRVEKVFLEPLNSDDWEMMQLNALKVESELLNQIRILWKGQVFPVWVNQVSFFVKVADIVPSVEPALLAEWTEIHIIPKERDELKSPSVSRLTKKQRKRNKYRQYQHLRRRGKGHKTLNLSATSLASDDSESSNHGYNSSYSNLHPINKPVFSLFRYLMKSAFQNDCPDSPCLKESDLDDDFQPLGLDFPLRVISLSKKTNTSVSLPLVLQSTTVFITVKTFLSHCNSDTIPDCFVAHLSKLLSPAEKKEISQSELHDPKASTAKEKTKKEKKDHHLSIGNKVQVHNSVCVNVVVLKSIEEEFDVPEALFRSTNFIAVPLELKRRLSLEISSCVRCQSVDYRPSYFDSILLHPLENLNQNFNDSLAASEFSNWAREADLNESSIVLCDGTLVKLPMSKGRTCNFIITLMQSENGDQNSSFLSPSLGATSSSGSESDKSISAVSAFPSYGFLNEIKLKRTTIKLGSYSPHVKKALLGPKGIFQKTDNLYQSIPALSLEALGGVKDISDRAMIDFEMWFKLRPMLTILSAPLPSNCGSMLIYGQKGVGKSALVHALCKKLINYPHFIFALVIKCLPLRGKRVETIARKWEMALSECVHRQPSILVFEDLDQLASAPATPEQEAGPDGLYYSNIAQVFVGLLEKIIVNKHSLVIVATSKSTHSLHPVLTQTKGRRIFQRIFEMKPPNLEQRSEILKSLVMSKLHLSTESITSVPLEKIALKAEGYVAQDLLILVDRATHAAWVRTKYNPQEKKASNQVILIEEDFKIALGGYTPSSLRGLKLQKGYDKTWKDVGGLHEVKKVLQQILTWPTKYKSLFSNCALKPQRNILLFGAPGTGKTLIAGVVASECGLNFISIKGPELLSKYIGASEQAVRDLFMRAMSAKPCILFFDEFDALAPRRGHDSTGVTDRVVNQLLTQMDGVENMEGVHVLAATSRPELIDPALLRPGRLDKCLHCPLPDENERLEILQALACKLLLSDDVDFHHIASMTEHFSGADLQALLYSAQIKSVHDHQNKKAGRHSKSEDDSGVDYTAVIERIIYMPSVEKGVVVPSPEETRKIIQQVDAVGCNMNNMHLGPGSMRTRRRSTISSVIEQMHLLEVLSEMKPSVSEDERQRYLFTFKKFHQSRGTNFPSSLNGGKRVTLA